MKNFIYYSIIRISTEGKVGNNLMESYEII